MEFIYPAVIWTGGFGPDWGLFPDFPRESDGFDDSLSAPPFLLFDTSDCPSYKRVSGKNYSNCIEGAKEVLEEELERTLGYYPVVEPSKIEDLEKNFDTKRYGSGKVKWTKIGVEIDDELLKRKREPAPKPKSEIKPVPKDDIMLSLDPYLLKRAKTENLDIPKIVEDALRKNLRVVDEMQKESAKEACPMANLHKNNGSKSKYTKLERIAQIHKIVFDHHYPTANKLAEALGVGIATINRDLDYMRKNLGAPLEYDVERCGYCYTKYFDVPDTSPTKEDVAAVEAAKKLLKYMGGNEEIHSLIKMVVSYARGRDLVGAFR